jgi:hypothetical protein
MNKHEELWERVQEILDRRGDPFDDPEVNARLLEDPQALGEVARLRSSLNLVESTPRPAFRWRTMLMPIAAGVIGLLALWQFAKSGAPGDEMVPERASQTAEAIPEARIIDFHLSVVTENSNRRITTVFEHENYSRQVDHLPGTGAGETDLLANTTFSTLTSRRYPR